MGKTFAVLSTTPKVFLQIFSFYICLNEMKQTSKTTIVLISKNMAVWHARLQTAVHTVAPATASDAQSKLVGMAHERSGCCRTSHIPHAFSTEPRLAESRLCEKCHPHTNCLARETAV